MKTLNGAIIFFVYSISIIAQGIAYYLGLHNMISMNQLDTVLFYSFLMMAIAALSSFTDFRSFVRRSQNN